MTRLGKISLSAVITNAILFTGLCIAICLDNLPSILVILGLLIIVEAIIIGLLSKEG